MRTVRSFANEEAELKHFDVKLKHTLKIVKIKATIYGAWMSSNTVSVYLGLLDRNIEANFQGRRLFANFMV